MVKIETERLIVLPYVKDDLEDLFSYRSDPNVSRFYSTQPKSINELEEYICEINEDFYKENSYTLFVIKLRDSNKLIGDIAVKSWGRKDIKSAIGFAINPAFQNRGYGKEAVKAFCKYLLEKEQRKRIQADVDSRNHISIKILEYVGMNNEESFEKIEEGTGIRYVEYMYGINKEK